MSPTRAEALTSTLTDIVAEVNSHLADNAAFRDDPVLLELATGATEYPIHQMLRGIVSTAEGILDFLDLPAPEQAFLDLPEVRASTIQYDEELHEAARHIEAAASILPAGPRGEGARAVLRGSLGGLEGLSEGLQRLGMGLALLE